MVAEIPETTSDLPPEMPLRRLYQVVFRHQKKMILFFLVVVVGVTALAFVMPEAYRSEAKLLVQVGRESVSLDPTASIGEQTLDPRTTWENELNSELEVARSNELVREVVVALGADRILQKGAGGGPAAQPGWFARTLARARDGVASLVPSRRPPLSAEDRAVLLLASKLDIRLVLDSSVIKIGFEAPEPELARAVVATLIQRYFEKHVAVHTTPGSFEFFAGETQRLREELEGREDELRELKNSAGITSAEEERTVLLGRLAALEKEYDLTLASIDSSAARVGVLEHALSTGELPEQVMVQETTTLVSPAMDLLRNQIHSLRLEEQSLLQTYEADTPPVRSVRERIALAEKLLEGEEPGRTQATQGMNPSRQNVLVALVTERGNLSSLEAKRDVLKPQLATMRAQLASINDLELAIRRKVREITSLEQRFQRNSANLEQVRVDQALQDQKITNLSVLQPATLPLTSTSLGKKTAVLAGIVLGLAGALALAFVADFLDQSLRSPEDVRRRLGVLAVASIPRSRALRRRRRIALAPLREFSVLKDRIADGNDHEGLAVAVTAAHRREGVSTVSANLANALALRGDGPVLLVDASLGAPSVHRTFEAGLTPGLVEKLASHASNGTQEAAVPNLSILTAGDVTKLTQTKAGQRPSFAVYDLLARDLEGLLGEWKREFRYVVLDLPALDEESQVPYIAARCDGALLVVAAEQGRWQVARHARDLLAASEARLLGVVLNKRRYPIPGWLYRTI